jgi:hypothetical protein
MEGRTADPSTARRDRSASLGMTKLRVGFFQFASAKWMEISPPSPLSSRAKPTCPGVPWRDLWSPLVERRNPKAN